MYPDVEAAIADTGLSPREHYINNGYFESRLPFRVRVDEIWYLNRYSDLKKSSLSDPLAHFISSGYKEGRLPFLPEFDKQYINKMYPNWSTIAENLNIEKDIETYYLGYGHTRLMIPYNIFR